MRFLVLTCFFALLFAGCKTTAEQPADNADTENVATQMTDGISGTVKYIQLEGGFYGIETEDGENLFPINLEDDYKEDGLKIIFKMKPRTDIFTTAMWGKTVEIIEIAKL